MLRYGHGAGGMHLVGWNPYGSLEDEDADEDNSEYDHRERRKNIKQLKQQLVNYKDKLRAVKKPTTKGKIRKSIAGITKKIKKYEAAEARYQRNVQEKLKYNSREDANALRKHAPKPKFDIAKAEDKITIVSMLNSKDRISRRLEYPIEKNPPVFQLFLEGRLGKTVEYNGERWRLVKIEKSKG